MTLNELSQELGISISSIRTNFPKNYKKFLEQGIKINREGKYPNTNYIITYIDKEQIKNELEENISHTVNFSTEEIPGEIFKECPLDSNLLISNMGRYKWKKETNKYWYGYKNGHGYRSITIGGKRYLMHRLVLNVFNPIEDAEAYTVDHINGIRDDNRLENLRWTTSDENVQFMLFKRADLNKELTRIIQNHGYEETLKILQEIE